MPTTLLPPPLIFGPSAASVMYNKNGAISATHVFGPSTYVLFHFFPSYLPFCSRYQMSTLYHTFYNIPNIENIYQELSYSSM